MAPVDYLWKLASLATNRKNKHEPSISSSTAALLSILFTSLYVLPFYLSPRTRPSPNLNRDAPSVIQARIRAVTLTVTTATIVTFLLLHYKGHLPIESALHYLGLWPISPIAIGQSFLLTLLLYMAPLYNEFYLERELSPLSTLSSRIWTSLRSSIGYRNFIAGPITEEVLFRSVLIPLHMLSPVLDSPKKLVFLTPLYFGIAHMHHFYEFRLSHPDMPLAPVLLRTVFQFGYTTVFGWYASFIYLRTGNLYAVCLIHTFCNYMGLPRLWGKVKLREPRQYSGATLGPVIRGKDDTETRSAGDSVHGKRRGFGPGTVDFPIYCTVIYYILLFAGAYAFYLEFFTLTKFENLALVSFGKGK